MSTWQWCDCAPTYKERCPGCNESVRLRPGTLIHWQGGHWHNECLLDRLTTDLPPVLPKFGPFDSIFP